MGATLFPQVAGVLKNRSGGTTPTKLGLPLAILMRSERLESICLTGMVTRIMLELLEPICLPGMVTRMLLVGV